MSLEATHMRFALDLMGKYKIKEKEKYVAGSVYPDSRYVTGIDRTLTHNENVLNREFAKDDFHKGWQIHQLCDIVHNRVFRQNIPFLDRHTKEGGWDEERFLEFTAAKVIQDMNDMRCFNLQENLDCLEYAHNPNNESLEKVKKYNQLTINVYKNKDKISIQDNYLKWLALGIDKKLALKMKKKTEEFAGDKKLLKRIESCYGDLLKQGGEALDNILNYEIKNSGQQ